MQCQGAQSIKILNESSRVVRLGFFLLFGRVPGVFFCAREGISATVLDMYCVKPLDKESVIRYAQQAKVVLTVEEHSPFGGLGSMVSQVVGEHCPRKVKNIALPDSHVITGTSKEVFDYYGMNGEGIAKTAKEFLA